MFIIIHLVAGLLPVNNFQFSWFWLVGSLIPDIDHIFLFIQHKLFSFSKIMDATRFEEKYGIRSKTKYVHSILGAMIVSLPVILINTAGGIYFFAGYLLHLLLDWPDKDVKQYLYPLKKELKGILPIASKTEQIISYVLLLIIIIYFLIK